MPLVHPRPARPQDLALLRRVRGGGQPGGERLPGSSTEGLALVTQGQDSHRAVWRHPGLLQADPVRDQRPEALVLPGGQGGRS